MKELNKIQIVDIWFHEIRNEVFVDYADGFELIAKKSVGDQNRTTHIGFRNITEYEAYINSIDDGYDAEDSIFNGYISKINTPQFNIVKRFQYGKRCDFEYEIIENQGNNCFRPTKGYCFIKCVNFITGLDYKQH